MIFQPEMARRTHIESKRVFLSDITSAKDDYDIAQIEHRPRMVIEGDSADDHIEDSIVVYENNVQSGERDDNETSIQEISIGYRLKELPVVA